MRRFSSSFASSAGRLVVTRPSTTCLPRRHEAQRGEAAGAGVVELQEEAVDVELAEQRLGDEVVAALGHPRGAEVAAAHVGGHGHARRTPGEAAVDVPHVGLVQVLAVAALLPRRARGGAGR